ncbi:hydroxymethylglutaryl-CoA lyase [Hoeflea sp. WL0058]|uniref:Hydroxymethylglutaryl-CoA lyase n=1 Tax=Flavimaribacter sediminis TaxID=2865987 RepID=A0AAE2ZMA5_9HYPH|nr:hydroxymethylglutaryl-CoA lyase [Flavimaribacter sediminis]MBW8635912.1 hydroxymethylglutaryl-CoA lyase [Flavimaribacter sediminis]
MTTRVDIIEVSPRDGIQNEKTLLSTQTKLELIDRATAAGIRAFEVTSFVNPKRVPQMADAGEVAQSLKKRSDTRYIGLVLNERGFERARLSGLEDVNCVVVATETFNRRNQGVAVDDTMADIARIAAMAHDSGVRMGVTIGAAFGCPFEGEVTVERVTEIAARLAELKPFEIALADTIGVAAPSDIKAKFSAVAREIGGIALRCHLHNTRNTGLANAVAAIESGVTRIDSSIGGVGGCPFAPAATGNIPTEDLVYMLDRMGVETGVDAQALIDTAQWLGAMLGVSPPGMLQRAGMFPPAAGAAA